MVHNLLDAIELCFKLQRLSVECTWKFKVVGA